MTINYHELETSHGRIAVRESSGEGAPLLMIHGNSSS
ncbi:MAG TPA: alpha/beta hydrolase, partial [Ochrobactrum sp.]|nr:alpha/beta hydrolase [Ochrobactrum sp.]